MNNQICVDIGDKVFNVHTQEIFVVEQLFSMRKLSGGKYTPNKIWSQQQLLNSDDWKLVNADVALAPGGGVGEWGSDAA